ncbi:hypothetical protein ACRE_049110 [Hapsidospora chrysogenum ATCC 11550]|uniref:Nucleoside phosphorylase domain-containing protein n=1 Tax=Hapsidospora chrysogenum (strain ATCC 11550 / CBS 779.69 / DSM 880 / IAM 14645 / JCM 23072 / IMI 49137) TaxID=857340 RepID=A0A086T4L5_HAPC1|nr:hypothetical protein ACRE_049110 [Hapsidospora chrysogenum ATCC 11550]
MTSLDNPDVYTIGWIAGTHTDVVAAIALLDERHDTPQGFKQHPSDTNVYSWGRIGEHNIAIAYCASVGPTSASALLTSLPQIRFCLLVGLGAAVARPDQGYDIRLGDVVVGSPSGVKGAVVQYDLGRATGGRATVRLTGSLGLPPRVLLDAMMNLRVAHEYRGSKVPDLLRGMRTAYPHLYVHPGFGNDRLFVSTYNHAGGHNCRMCDVSKEVKRGQRDTTDPYIHYGVIASGNHVIEDASTRDTIADGLGEECICFEMAAADLSADFPCLVVKGICDYADSHWDNRWLRYASATAAACAKELLGFISPKRVQATQRANRRLETQSATIA